MLGAHKRYVTARAIIIRDGKLLAFHRKRHDHRSDTWITYYSLPGGEIDRAELPEDAVVRELLEEMGVEINLHGLVAHYVGQKFEHYVYHADITQGQPRLMDDSEEAQFYMSDSNQYIVTWVPVDQLTSDNLLYYNHFLDVIQRLASGETIKSPVEINTA